jgi:ribosome-binding protein aMBF1 (putative translation factor)
MIKNERQLNVASSKLSGLEEARASAGTTDKTSWRAYTDLIDDLQWEMEQYCQVRDQQMDQFPITCVDDLGPALIKARIHNGWTHSTLAKHAGVQEQSIQRDESRDYENAGLARLAELLDVLGFELVGEVRPKVKYVVGTYAGKSASNAPEVTFATPSTTGRGNWFGSDSFSISDGSHGRSDAKVDA